MVSSLLIGLFLIILVAIFSDEMTGKQHVFDLGLRFLRFAALPPVFPI